MNVALKTCFQLGLIVLGTTLGTAWTYHFKADRPTLYLVQTTTLEADTPLIEILAWAESPQWIDTRSDAAFGLGHIPGAISLRPDNAETQMTEHFEVFLDQRKTFVIYGPDADSQAIVDRLEGLGLTKAHRLQGGWEAWQAHKP